MIGGYDIDGGDSDIRQCVDLYERNLFPDQDLAGQGRGGQRRRHIIGIVPVKRSISHDRRQ